MFFLLATTLLSGAIFYSTVEKLSPFDSLYLSFMTLTTIGYGDVHPVTDL
ncbi:ion channel, partial [Enterococcus faecalis]